MGSDVPGLCGVWNRSVRFERVPVVALAAAFLALGCATPKPDSQFTILMPDRVPDGFTVLESGVEEGWCTDFNFLDALVYSEMLEPDFGVAVASALRAHPGANAMANVTFTVRTTNWILLQEVCGYVEGDVGVWE